VRQPVPRGGTDWLMFLADHRNRIHQVPMILGGDADRIGAGIILAGQPFHKPVGDGAACRAGAQPGKARKVFLVEIQTGSLAGSQRQGCKGGS